MTSPTCDAERVRPSCSCTRSTRARGRWSGGAWVPGLASRFSTSSLDLLGFGASAHPPLDYTASLYVDLLRDFLVDVVREPAVLVGSSLGGTYAIAVASENPALVRGRVRDRTGWRDPTDPCSGRHESHRQALLPEPARGGIGVLDVLVEGQHPPLPEGHLCGQDDHDRRARRPLLAGRAPAECPVRAPRRSSGCR